MSFTVLLAGAVSALVSAVRLACLVSLSALSAVACRTPPVPSPSEASVSDYAPLAIGSSWTYAVRFPGQTGERTVQITGRDDEGYFVDDAGGAFAITDAGLRDRDRYLIRAPLEVGQGWRSVVSASAVERYTITSVGESCESRAGRFSDCLVVESRLRRDDRVTLRVRFTWAKGVGLAKIETTAEIAGEGDIPQTEQSLTRYRLASTDRPPAEPAESSEPAASEAAPDAWGR